MELTQVRSWKHEFARSTDTERYREILRRHHDDLRRKKEKDEEDREERFEDLDEMLFAVMATQTEIDAYLVTTAHYQTATYDAIIENQQLLEAVRLEREKLLEKAYVLPDGRRVFESEDGVRVFDENGVELDPSVISADDIEDWRPKHEQMTALDEREAFLADEQTELFEYQKKLDEARERLEAGEISQKDFDALKKELDESMPERVRDNLPDEFKPEQQEQEKSEELTVESAPLSRPDPSPMMGA